MHLPGHALDLRTLVPLDAIAVLASVRRGRALC
jgi:pyruvate/2-oxoglutarate/acetoin dehydrogenase E1 component